MSDADEQAINEAIAPVLARHLCFTGCTPATPQVQWITDAVLAVLLTLGYEKQESIEATIRAAQDEMRMAGWVRVVDAIAAVEALPWEFTSQDDYDRLMAVLRGLGGNA